MAAAQRERVVVGMSGGVDSSVAAALLQEQCYEVIGVTILVWSPPGFDMGNAEGCCGLGAAEDARRVAARLGIRHYVLDFKEIFYRDIVQNYVDEYRRGRTPNPCVRCNRFIKFGALLERADALGARYVATGHYARVRYDEDRRRWLLLRARDRSKDQSYALYCLTQEQLSRALFPLGEWAKADTRRRAADLDLPTATKPDSQETCFVPNNDYPQLLQLIAPDTLVPGPVVNPAGEVVGEHPGVAFYTVGQRRRLGLGSRERLYVALIEPEARRVTVAPGNHPSLRRSVVEADQANLVAVERLTEPVTVTAKIRYNMADQPAVLEADDGTPVDQIRVRFPEPVRAVTPGQSLVCYQGDIVVCGGIIRHAV
ncbi:MAG: tRNA 2-thiouridine(34) synthase MnmA [Armatimonadetes bacterium]|nr:tRNA 2-thiouridine(34) synthase MnmA [Armatimonadota bacterium]